MTWILTNLMRLTRLAWLTLCLLLLGCTLPAPGGYSTPTLRYTPSASSPAITSSPSLTPSPLPSPSATSESTASPTVPSATAGPPINLLNNPGFEGDYHEGPGGLIAPGWEPFYCAPPYTVTRCLAPVEWKPYEPYLFIPEYNRANQPERVHSGESAQHIFSPHKLTDSGVYQDVHGLVVGDYYYLSMYGQMWLADGQHKVILPDGTEVWRDEPCAVRDSTNTCINWGSTPYTSDYATEDDFNAGWMVAGVGSCTSSAFDNEGVVWGRPYGYFDGLYDHYGEVSVGFQAWDSCARVFLRAWNKYAKGHSDFYFDSAMLVRATFDMPTPEATPTRIGPVTPAPGVTPTPTPEAGAPCTVFPCTYEARLAYRVISSGLNIRSGPGTRYSLVGSYAQGAAVEVRCVTEVSLTEVWGSASPCAPYPARWVAIRIGSVVRAWLESV